MRKRSTNAIGRRRTVSTNGALQATDAKANTDAAFEGLTCGSRIQSTCPTTMTQITKRPGPASSRSAGNQSATHGRYGRISSDRPNRGSSESPTASQKGSSRGLPRRTSDANPAATRSDMTTKPISSASDGNMATRSVADVVPATSKDARLSQSAMPAVAAAAMDCKKAPGAFFMPALERCSPSLLRIENQRRRYDVRCGITPHARRRAGAESGCPIHRL